MHGKFLQPHLPICLIPCGAVPLDQSGLGMAREALVRHTTSCAQQQAVAPNEDSVPGAVEVGNETSLSCGGLGCNH